MDGDKLEDTEAAAASARDDMDVERIGTLLVFTRQSFTTDGVVSSDDEIDYSIKPEFYDPRLDDKDELWVHKQRKGRMSDAILSCPACFTTLCLDCQRHEKYVTQYRAMFVLNCKINEDEVRYSRRTKSRKSKNYKKSSDYSRQRDDDEVLWPVCCSVCSTEVGVFDQDEVYHFLNVLPSYS